ncbi:D-alanyl-D-alanine carboxypeptidase family protein [Sessilibacter sp. MAH2]
MSNFLTRSFWSLFVIFFVAVNSASAQQLIIPAPPQLAASSYLLIDAATGEVLVEHNSHEPLPPASLTKMMSSYIVSGEIDRGHINMTDMVPISVRAWKMGGSRMFIREGTEVSVKDLLRGVIIQSGNDATVALAEYIAGSEEAFVDIMNQQAALLGMNNTQFKNSTGWPAEGHLTTAWDLSLLARALINDHPEHYNIYSEQEFTYGAPGEETKTQSNRNKLLFRDKSVDGIKTGHTNEAGYCLVASAVRDDMRLISVVMGTRSESARADESQKLLAHGFRYYETHKQFSADEVLATARVWAGQDNHVDLIVGADLDLTIPRGSGKNLQSDIRIDETIRAPIEQNQALGEVTITLDGEVVAKHSLLAANAVAEAGFLARLWDGLKLFFINLFSS